jgi:uncharacterized repeat protein (TIGR01451 family)
LGGTTTLTFSVSNPAGNAVTLTGVGFTDSLPSGLVVATPNGLTGSCPGGTGISISPGTIILSGAPLTPGASCTFTINVTGSTAGVKNNSVAASSNEGGTGAASNSSVSVEAPATFSALFGASTIPVGGLTTLTFSITNPAGNPVTMTGISFTDTLSAGLVVATPNGLTGPCGGGTITAVAASGSISLIGRIPRRGRFVHLIRERHRQHCRREEQFRNCQLQRGRNWNCLQLQRHRRGACHSHNVLRRLGD